jgi:hypothetical protein
MRLLANLRYRNLAISRKGGRKVMFDAQGAQGAREYLWFALLLIVFLATVAVHPPETNIVSARAGVMSP